jgi:hypothetical protein
VTSGGQEKEGGVKSVLVMICVQVLVLPQISVARKILFIVSPQDSGFLTSVKVIVSISQLSVAVAMPVLFVKIDAVHPMVIFCGHVITGLTKSSKYTFAIQESIALQRPRIMNFTGTPLLIPHKILFAFDVQLWVITNAVGSAIMVLLRMLISAAFIQF